MHRCWAVGHSPHTCSGATPADAPTPPPLTSTLSAAGVARDVELGVAVREWGVYVALLSRSCACCRSLCRVSVCVVCMSVRVRARACVWRVIVCVRCWRRAGTHAGEHTCVLEAERARHALLASFSSLYLYHDTRGICTVWYRLSRHRSIEIVSSLVTAAQLAGRRARGVRTAHASAPSPVCRRMRVCFSHHRDASHSSKSVL